MSERLSSLRPSACSGDMYAGVPTVVPTSVTIAVLVAAAGSAASSSLAMPKSSTFTLPSSVIITFDGFRSRWMMPAACAFDNASAMSMATLSACFNGNPLGGMR